MGKLNYTATVSLDGYVADAAGDFQWSAPNGAVFDAHIDRMATVSTEVLGRKTYTLMQYWETDPVDEVWTAAEWEFARRWRGIEKVVVSSTLMPDETGSGRVHLLSGLGLAELQQIVDDAAGVVEIFGPTVAAPAIRAGLVEEFAFFVVPKIVGGGLRALPGDARLDVVLVEHRTFDNGVALLRYVHPR
ncbi:dihydrofolate reductase family protein [Mycobacterium sp. CVI_P3]|uniref:Dihydrofolate reductase family protein n=1 Tax=Mycobacterium pinniadriaticum TaxID=2994102 RepID=A0ABT3SL72_9MYCO|nr:dihydrofolate reductase family protein [Mycobacterium pinniadriaticum]MCX2933819.1 dihydrofolate reductase family protein [Mycobacterium pinniadriaticum]MCX2940241.1 dihydrofolate reductase family protein [Mycobacterium pinniadriaticum]